MANNGGEQASASATLASSEVIKVSIKVPPFWSSNPSLWFRQLEIQFVLNGITADMTKFYYTVSQLELKYLQEVEDVEEIGDRTPSQFLRHLKTLAGDNTLSENFLRTMWMNRLPASTRTVLATRMYEPVDKMATLADKINEMTPIGHCAAVTPNPEIAALCEQDVEDGDDGVAIAAVAAAQAHLNQECAGTTGGSEKSRRDVQRPAHMYVQQQGNEADLMK
nr:uncharacterized protein LOC116431929 [Nomia melanderi]